MAKRIILAVAGAGKTYHICHEINANERNLILAFTHENIHNIQKELCDEYGTVPELTTVSTFHKFVYHQLILPYEPSIAQCFNCNDFVSRGISMVDPPPKTIKTSNGRAIANPQYKNKTLLRHYVTDKNQYYCSNLSELVLYINKNRQSLIKRLIARLNLFYDCIMIDEFQDFREFDYELIMALSKQLNNVVMVGDYYQHSVSAKNNSGKPFKKKSIDVDFETFVEELIKLGFEVDLSTLNKSRRCSEDVCNYITNKLCIDIKSIGVTAGEIKWVDEPISVLNDDKIIKLVYSESDKYLFSSINWSYSKGDTFDSACVILTSSLDNLDNDKFNPNKIKTSTINKLYVAMTRSRGTLYIMKSSIFKQVKDNYIKK